MGVGDLGSALPEQAASDLPVHVFTTEDERGNIGAMLAHLRMDTRFSSGAEGPLSSSAANIVSDAIAQPLDQCRALAQMGPVILISERTDFEFRLAAARSGVKAIVKRPVDPIQIAGWLAYLTHRDGPGRISVVVVEDHADTADFTGEILRCAGMAVEVVCDPSLAIETIERTLPDLVLMDLYMPGVDGMELAEVIRQNRHFVSMPIVFLSAERNEDRQTAARRVGGDDFIQKPIDPRKLVDQVLLRAHRARMLRSMIERDGLTGLLNHSRFHEHLTHELERCRRTGGILSLAMIDIDHFKSVNDRYGHPCGDGVLRSLANLLTSSLRRIDIICRYGGEEFGIIFLDTEASDAVAVLDNVRQMFSASDCSTSDHSFRVSFSAGVASGRDHETAEDLVAAADRALYSAKSAGRNRVQSAMSSVAPKIRRALRA